MRGGRRQDRVGPTGEGSVRLDHAGLAAAEDAHPPRVRNMDGFETRAIHAGQEPDPLTGAVVPPIYQVSTYAQDGVGGLRGGYEYSRSANPTRTALQECLAALEAPGLPGATGLAFASGLAAEDTLLRTVCRPGDHAVIPDDAYGGTYRLFAKVAAPWGLDYTPAALTDPDAVAAAIVPGRTKLVWVETPDQPAAQHRRHRRARRRRARGRSHPRRRQHLRLAVPAAAAAARRRRRRAQHDQVPRRPQRRRRGRARHGRRRPRRPAHVPPERDGLRARPVRLLARAARHQDARRAHGPAQRQCARGRRVPGRAPGRVPGALARPRRSPRS